METSGTVSSMLNVIFLTHSISKMHILLLLDTPDLCKEEAAGLVTGLLPPG